MKWSSIRKRAPQGVRVKLTAAFLAIMVLFSLATLVSDRGFRKLGGNLAEIHEVTLPRVLALQEVGIRGPEILQLANAVGRARDGDALDLLEPGIARERARLGEAVLKCGKVGAGLSTTLAGIGENLEALLGAQRIRAIQGHEVRDSALGLMERATDMAFQLDSDRILLDPEEEASALHAEVIRDLQVELLAVVSAFRSIRDADSSEALAKIGPELDVARRRIARLLGKLPEAVRPERARVIRGLLRDRSDPLSLLAQQADYLVQVADVEERIREGQALNDELLAGAAGIAEAAKLATEESNSAAVARAQGARTSARVYWLSALLLSVLILGYYVRGRVVRPLEQLVADLTRLSQGDLSVEVSGGGDAELAAIASAAEVFRKNAKELEETLTTLEHRNHTLTEFAHVASHDLKSPMRAIANLANWVQEDCAADLSDESTTHLALMKERIEKMESLLEDLLRYSRLGNDESIAVPVRLSEIVDDVVDLLGVGPEIRIVRRGLDLEVVTIPAPLKLCLRNLIQNAVNHSGKESPTITVEARRLVDEDDQDLAGDPGMLLCCVTDDGPGIPKDQRAGPWGSSGSWITAPVARAWGSPSPSAPRRSWEAPSKSNRPRPGGPVSVSGGPYARSKARRNPGSIPSAIRRRSSRPGACVGVLRSSARLGS